MRRISENGWDFIDLEMLVVKSGVANKACMKGLRHRSFLCNIRNAISRDGGESCKPSVFSLSFNNFPISCKARRQSN